MKIECYDGEECDGYYCRKRKRENKKWIILACLIIMLGAEVVVNGKLNNLDVLIAVEWFVYGPNHAGVIRNEFL
jgi:hypothetical protein